MTVALSAMNKMQFDNVHLGTPVEEVVKKVGKPYDIHNCGNGVYEYEYIERISMNNELVYQNHYFLKVVNGHVVSKDIRDESRPAYDQLWQVDPNYPTYP